MEYAPLFFSLLFFTTFAAYLFLGTHALQFNPREKINKHFFLVCLFLGIWSLGFSLANSASDLETCFFWRRISALGWVPIYSVFLHFFLTLSHKDTSPRKPSLYYLLHIPALIFLYAFSLSNSITAQQFNFIRTGYGWINKAVQNN